MNIRKTEPKDLDRIMEMVEEAREYFRQSHIDQWQDGYPSRDSFETDMQNGESYVLEEDGHIMATVAVLLDGEPAYEKIYDGTWLSYDIPYAAIHRVVVDGKEKGKGYAGQMLAYAEQLCMERGITSMKNDTHEDNHSMQRMLKKNGFVYCGVIYLEDGAKRVAFEKRLYISR